MTQNRSLTSHSGEGRRTSLRRTTDGRFAQAALRAPYPLWLSNADGAFDFFNDAWLAYTGRSLDDEAGNGWQKGLHPEDADEFRAAYHAAIRSGAPFKLEHRLRRHDGEYRWVLTSATPLTAPDGSFQGFVGSCIDVTERHRLEDRTSFLLRVDDRLRPLIDSTEITRVAAELLGSYLQVNRCVYAAVHADQDTADLVSDFNQGVPSIVGRYTLLQFGEEFRRLMREGRAYVISDAETDPRTADALPSYHAANIRSVICVPLLKQGKVVACVAVQQVTPRAWRSDEVELVLQVASRCWESLERSRVTRELINRSAVVENSSDAIITKDLNSIITSWNKSAERIFGYTADEVIGKPVTILFPPDHINEETEIVKRIRRGELVNHYETVRRRKDGTLIPLSLTISPLRGSDGVIIGASKTARDISAQKTYERQLIDQANELEQFAYVASHDLQEPLRKLSIYAELLTKRFHDAGGPEAEKYAGFISDAVTRMHKLISELLDYSRASRSELKLEPVNLENAARGVLNDLEVAIRENGATVNIAPMPAALGNPFQMHQLFQNLIGNAVKFRGKDAPRIDVSARVENNEIVVAVRDNGIGIEPQYQDRVFRVFQRLHSAGKYPGTGIGLAICKKIVERHGGKIWLESAPGKGTTVFFTLPAAPPAG
jgi:PAS domain S-box-containing protein